MILEATQIIEYEEYWVLRGIHEEKNGVKTVVKEVRQSMMPTENCIVEFLLREKGVVDFVSVEHNFRLVKESDGE